MYGAYSFEKDFRRARYARRRASRGTLEGNQRVRVRVWRDVRELCFLDEQSAHFWSKHDLRTSRSSA